MYLTTPEQYKAIFESLISNESLSCEDLIPSISYLIGEAPISFQQIHFPFIIRTSPLQFDEIPPANISRCSYNPNTSNIGLQRCNYPHQQVFYGSVPGGTTGIGEPAFASFLETCFDRVNEDDSFLNCWTVVTRWRFRKPPFLWVLPYHTHSIDSNEHFRYLHKQFDDYLKEKSEENDESYRQFQEKLEYLSSLFCRSDQKKSLYRITATFYNELLNWFSNINSFSLDGLIYPSANTGGEGMNMILDKNFIKDENIFCDLAVLHQMHRDKSNLKSVDYFPFFQAIPDEKGNLRYGPVPQESFNPIFH